MSTPVILLTIGLVLIAAAVLFRLAVLLLQTAIPLGILLVIAGLVWLLVGRSRGSA